MINTIVIGLHDYSRLEGRRSGFLSRWSKRTPVFNDFYIRI